MLLGYVLPPEGGWVDVDDVLQVGGAPPAAGATFSGQNGGAVDVVAEFWGGVGDALGGVVEGLYTSPLNPLEQFRHIGLAIGAAYEGDY